MRSSQTWQFWCLILLIPMACSSSSPQNASETKVSNQGTTPLATNSVKGIDVSHFSGDINWNQVVAGGQAFAFAKATEGVDYTDPMFQTNWTGMATAKIIKGAYHFYVVDDDPQQQAANFINQVNLAAGDLPPVVDIETAGTLTGETLAANLQIWLDTIEDHYGVKPMIYTNANFWNTNVPGDFSNYALWIAEYDVDQPTLPNGFDSWLIWQYQGDGKVAGVSSDVDLDTFQGDHSALEKILIQP